MLPHQERTWKRGTSWGQLATRRRKLASFPALTMHQHATHAISHGPFANRGEWGWNVLSCTGREARHPIAQ